MIMNRISISLQERDSEEHHFYRELERRWQMQSKSPYDLFNSITDNDQGVIDELPMIISELAIEKALIEGKVLGTLLDLHGRDFFEEAVVREFYIYPYIERLLTIESAIARMKAKWVGYYQPFTTLYHKGLFESDVQEARKVSLVRTAEKAGLKLQKIGANYRCCCPLHQEKTPSFVLFINTNSWYCFGCHEGGDGICLVIKTLGYTFRQAVCFIIS